MYQLPVYLSWRVIWFTLFCLTCAIQLFYYGWYFIRLAFFKKTVKEQSQQHPVSVIICARDEAANLAENLPGALSQTYPSTHEVIVVNHNSQDDTRYLLEEFKKTFKGLHIVNLEYEAKGIPGKKYPLSMGIREARHEVLVLTDSDCLPASEFWVERMQDGYLEGTQIVLGYSPYKKKQGLLNKLIRFETFHSAPDGSEISIGFFDTHSNHGLNRDAPRWSAEHVPNPCPEGEGQDEGNPTISTDSSTCLSLLDSGRALRFLRSHGPHCARFRWDWRGRNPLGRARFLSQKNGGKV